MEKDIKLKTGKTILSFLSIFICIVIVLLILMVGVAKIPKKLIKENMIESANYLLEKPMYYELIKDCDATKIDHYADAITLNTVYNLDSNESLKSVLYSKFYGNNGNVEARNLLKTVTEENCEPQCQYIRYWHGEMIILKVMLMILNIKQIYMLNAAILIVLTAILSYKLIKNKMYAVFVGVIIAMIATNAFVAPLALEYISMYFVMLIGSIVLLHYAEKGKTKNCILIFFLIGIFTCFFDFLTIETITLLVPLIILLVYKYKDCKNIQIKEISKYILKIVIAWASGYVLMWIAKWGISVIYLNEDIKKVVFDNAIARIKEGTVYGLEEPIKTSKSVILRNIHCLFPICFFDYKNAIIFISAFILISFLFITRKDEDKKLSLILFALGIVPYIRYLIIKGHSLNHYFFTYRAQFATILAIIIGSYYMIDKKLLRRKSTCKIKKN